MRPAESGEKRLEINYEIAAPVVDGPDGRRWVQLQLILGMSGHVIKCPPEHAADVGRLVADAMTKAGEQAKRENLGLSISGVIPPLNGQGAVPLPPRGLPPGMLGPHPGIPG